MIKYVFLFLMESLFLTNVFANSPFKAEITSQGYKYSISKYGEKIVEVLNYDDNNFLIKFKVINITDIILPIHCSRDGRDWKANNERIFIKKEIKISSIPLFKKLKPNDFLEGKFWIQIKAPKIGEVIKFKLGFSSDNKIRFFMRKENDPPYKKYPLIWSDEIEIKVVE